MKEKDTNIEAALAKELESGMTVSTELTPDDGPAGKQVLIRLPESDRERWKEAADKHGKTMSQMIRDAVNEHVKGVLDCPHPTNQRRYYPWSEMCLACGTRIR